MYHPRTAGGRGYGQRTVEANMPMDAAASDTAGGTATFPNMGFREVEARIGSKITVALVDCEGCIGHALHPEFLLQPSLQLVLIEEDQPRFVDYPAWYRRLTENGFRRVWESHDTVAPGREWSQEIVHSAWSRGRYHARRGENLCWRRARVLSREDLNCSVLRPNR